MIDTITAGGKVDAPVPQRVFWCTFEGAVAIVLLLGGGLGALQAMVISTGLPFTIILLMICVSLVLGLMSESGIPDPPRVKRRSAPSPSSPGTRSGVVG